MEVMEIIFDLITAKGLISLGVCNEVSSLTHERGALLIWNVLQMAFGLQMYHSETSWY